MFSGILFALAMSGQLPAKPSVSPVKVTSSVSAERKADMDKLIAKRKLNELKAASKRSAKAAAQYKAYQDQLEYEAKMAPVWAKMARDQAILDIEQQKANGILMMGDAAEKQVKISAKMLEVQQRKAGLSAMPLPDGSVIAYPGQLGGGRP